jgi:hypothetical protein
LLYLTNTRADIYPTSEEVRTVHQVGLTELHDSRAESRRESSGTRSLHENLTGGLELQYNLHGLGEQIGFNGERLLLSRRRVPRTLDIDISSPLINISKVSRGKSLTTKVKHLVALLGVLAIGENSLEELVSGKVIERTVADTDTYLSDSGITPTLGTTKTSIGSGGESESKQHISKTLGGVKNHSGAGTELDRRDRCLETILDI